MGAVAILWHLHQPDYRDPTNGRPVMPWTRLHALRGYRDLFVEVMRREEAVTLNVVPVLLDQLLYYAEGGADEHLELTRQPADSLDDRQRDQLRATFVAGHPSMIACQPDYAALAGRVGRGERLPVGAWRDLQVWSTLAWFGATALADFEGLAGLRAKGSDFTEADKALLLGVQARVLAELPDQIRAVARSAHASVSTTPYHHPILPLLVNTQHARRCMTGVPEDVRFAWPEDALRHLVSARERMEAFSGVAPQGLWPSEGSVSPEVVELAGQAGFSWLASDEEVLHRSVRAGASGSGGWDLGHGVTGFFRDRELSDRIGFRYAHMTPDEAAADLVEAIASRADGGVLSIVLDGENPWEAFADAGGRFRERLDQRLRASRVRRITLDAAAELPAVGTVSKLHTGSWIGADFRIWIGHREDHVAWRLLAEAREVVERSPNREEALQKLLPAEGSDWTWWFGEDFHTPFAAVFDRAFRGHLKAAWIAAGREPPAHLDDPIASLPPPEYEPPSGPVSGRLDRVAWVHWRNAGILRWPPGSSMATGQRPPGPVRFGWDLDGILWVRISLSASEGEDPWTVCPGSECATLAAAGDRSEGPTWTVARLDQALLIRADRAFDLVLQRHGPEGLVSRFPVQGALRLPEGRGTTWWTV